MSLVARSAERRQGASKALDFVLSDEGQAIWANAFLRPARAGDAAEGGAGEIPAGQRVRARQGRRLREDGAGAEGASPSATWRKCADRCSARGRHAGPRPCDVSTAMTAARSFTLLLSLPLAIVVGAFWLLPMARLCLRSCHPGRRLDLSPHADGAALPAEPGEHAWRWRRATTAITLMLATLVGLLPRAPPFPGTRRCSGAADPAALVSGRHRRLLRDPARRAPGLIREISRQHHRRGIVFAYRPAGPASSPTSTSRCRASSSPSRRRPRSSTRARGGGALARRAPAQCSATSGCRRCAGARSPPARSASPPRWAPSAPPSRWQPRSRCCRSRSTASSQLRELRHGGRAVDRARADDVGWSLSLARTFGGTSVAAAG